MTTRRIYSSDIKVFATLYVVADSEKEARRKMKKWLGSTLEVGTNENVCGMMFSNPELPDEHVSPTMTIADRQRLHIELAEECEVDDEEDDEAG